ncbi:MAG: orotate phosphoribosyltransferase [Bacteroidota bacterium]
MENTAKTIAAHLLQIKAIKLQPANPFTWASGWKSPIYCDNRKTLSHPETRTYIRDSFASVISKKYPEADVIAGVATGAIAHGALVADVLKKPFVYVRSSAKDHGLGNRVEGEIHKGQKVVVVEDLISTGGSSIKAVEALREINCEVLGMVAIFTYGFGTATDNFEKALCELTTLSNYNSLIELALEQQYITHGQLETLQNWRKSPQTWS